MLLKAINVSLRPLVSTPTDIARGDLLMRKSNCPESKMSDATITNADHLVSEAKGWSAQLLARVHYGPGDTVEAAMYRAEQKYGVPAQAFWALRYRTPKDILASVYLTLKAAYEAECGRQEARLRHELALVKALPSTPAREALVAETEAALGIAPSLKTGTEG